MHVLYRLRDIVFSAIVGMTCSGNSDCTTLDSNSECSSLSCACVSGYTNTAGGACSGTNILVIPYFAKEKTMYFN